MAKNIYTCEFCGYQHHNHSTFCSHLFHEHDGTYPEVYDLVKEMQLTQYRRIVDIPHLMFLKNKYTKWYYQIIRNARQKDYDGYTEKHHILPHSIGGPDTRDNLITISAKEHFLLYLLLIKMLPKSSKGYNGMFKAFYRMAHHSSNERQTSAMFSLLRDKFSKVMSESQTGKSNSQHGTTWIANFSTKESKKIKEVDLKNWLDLGWINKRVLNFDLYNENGHRIDGYISPCVVKLRQERKIEREKKKLKREKRNAERNDKKKSRLESPGASLRSYPKSKYPLTSLHMVQRYRMKNGKAAYVPDYILKIKSFSIMTKGPKATGFDFLADDLDTEFHRWKDNLYQEHIVQNMSFPELSRKYGMANRAFEKLFENIGIPKKTSIKSHKEWLSKNEA